MPMTASRRLQLAAEGSGAIGIALRRWRRQTEAADFGQPTAATTRWRVSALPSTPLPVPGVGRPRWLVELIRCRAGESADFELEACDDKGRLASSCRPGPPIGSGGRRATQRLRLRRRWSWSAATEGGAWCWRRMLRLRQPGLRVGMPATKAQALVPGLVIQDADPAADAEALDRLASGCCSASRRSSPPIRPTASSSTPPAPTICMAARTAMLADAGRAAGERRPSRPRRHRRQLGRGPCAGALQRSARLSSSEPGKAASDVAPLPIAALAPRARYGRRPPRARLRAHRRPAGAAARAARRCASVPSSAAASTRRPARSPSRSSPSGRRNLIEVRRAFAEPIGAAETIARYIGKLAAQLCEQLGAQGPRRAAARSHLPPRRQPRAGGPRRHGHAGPRRQAPDAAALRQDRDHRSRLRHRDR